MFGVIHWIMAKQKKHKHRAIHHGINQSFLPVIDQFTASLDQRLYKLINYGTVYWLIDLGAFQFYEGTALVVIK